MRRRKDPTKCPKQKTTQAQKTPTTPTAATSTGALHPLRGGAPVTWRCTRTEEAHCLRIGCTAPTHKKNAELARRTTHRRNQPGRVGRINWAPLTLPHRERHAGRT